MRKLGSKKEPIILNLPQVNQGGIEIEEIKCFSAKFCEMVASRSNKTD